MGGSESTLGSIEGYQVARVLNSSPAHVAGLLPYFDIIVGMDGMPLDSDHKTQFQQYVTKNLEKEITLSVYNLRIRALRDVIVTPTTSWGGVGVLGCSLNWDVADRCVENTWHIVEVFNNSPAAGADLVAQRDYLLGMQTADDETITMFTHSDDFQDRLQRWKAHIYAGGRQKQNLTLLLLIFDSVNNSIKETLVDMGANFSLGIDVANGYLHVVPSTAGTTKLPQIKKFYQAPDPRYYNNGGNDTNQQQQQQHYQHQHQAGPPQAPPQPFPEAPGSSASLASHGSNSNIAAAGTGAGGGGMNSGPATPGRPQPLDNNYQQHPQQHSNEGSPQQPPSPPYPPTQPQQPQQHASPQQQAVYQPPAAPQQQPPTKQAGPGFPQPAGGFQPAAFPRPGSGGFPAPSFPAPPPPPHTH